MNNLNLQRTDLGKWMALAAALLGWMFDGLEMGLFPLIGRPALQSLIPGAAENEIGKWFSISIAAFLVGAATGGVLFGWLGDRIGRVRAMMLSVLTYAAFTGMGYWAQAAWHIAALRFLAALGMGGEWSLGVALVNELWPQRSRAFLAGLIGAAANVGFLLIGLVGLLVPVTPQSWRIMMVIGAAPALLTFFIRLFVPESEKWRREQKSGATSHWATRDLSGVLVGALAVIFTIALWAVDESWACKQLAISLAVLWSFRVIGTLLGIAVATLGFLYPVQRYLQRSIVDRHPEHGQWPTIKRMLLAAGLSAVALLGTWGSIQWAPLYAHKLTNGQLHAKELTQIAMATGAILATIAAAFIGDWLGRRWSYVSLCAAALASVLLFWRNASYDGVFLLSAFLAGGITASFFGWLPLYLPELFRTRVRATGQGFSFNFGRILAAIGALQTGALFGLLGDYPKACTMMGLVYVAGIIIIWFVPETKGKPLPD